jgi:hypothetical protein
MDEASARVMGDHLARALSAAQPPTVNVAAPVINMEAAAAPSVVRTTN